MDKNEILTFISKNPMGCLGTIDGQSARVRFMDTFRSDEHGLIFYTGKVKPVFQQIVKNPQVEVCYYANGTQIRVRGKMEIIEDLKLKKEVVKNRSFLALYYKKEEDYKQMGLLRLKGKATVWTMKSLTEPTTFVEL
jgi:pyridoxamine 5'-phosphate oxidase